ncbi:neuroepithelial cell-transforming gene 1 protein-like [Dreissena polymorpha]|uniref:neuroepithelial cell-transforming gene 1 protein-like n=1 Tax=Dreissena polymorpha TaxID=45954 RepID=UPI00226486FC|nr:neuroepithelial cell-transforming gene 1 protein-like [Dreissena polymorpha]
MGDENSLRVSCNEEKKARRHSVIGLFPELSILRKRKRKIEDDCVSLQSFESGTSQQKKSRRKSLLRVSSLANLLSPKANRKQDTLKRTLSFKVPLAPHVSNKCHAPSAISPYKAPPPSPGRCRLSRTWSDMMNGDSSTLTRLSNNDIKLQEAIYELYQGELDLIEDLNVVKNTYQDSMRKLQLMTEGELQQIFGPLDDLIPIHEELVNRLKGQRLPDGTTGEIGQQLVDWVPNLRVYVPFCANQVFGKVLLDEKKEEPAIDDFLQRCQDSPFSRKLDLWGLLDGARSRFMKYPLLLKSILKYSSGWLDTELLGEAVRLAESVVADADRRTGEAKCIYFRSRITYLYEDQRHSAIETACTLLCNGTLKNNKGSKLQLFLFDTIVVLTRLVTQGGQQRFQVYRDPIPVCELLLEDLKDGEVKMGSFRTAFSSSQTSKNIFRVSHVDSNKAQSHTLMCNDEHDKRQWLHCFKIAINAVPKTPTDNVSLKSESSEGE